MLDLHEAHQFFRLVHAFIGFSGLVLFWVPVFARKGGPLHVRSGRLFAWCATFVSATGLAASAWGLIDPMRFLDDGEAVSAGGERSRLAVENLRFILSITGFLGLGVLAGVAIGTRIIREDGHDRLRGTLPLGLVYAFGLWSAALALYGGGTLAAAWAGQHFLTGADAMRYALPLVLGGIGVYGAIGDVQFIRGPRPTQRERRSMHIECMIGAGAAFYAAFLLLLTSRIVPMPGLVQLLATVMPLAIGTVAIRLVRGRDGRSGRGGCLSAATPASGPDLR